MRNLVIDAERLWGELMETAAIGAALRRPSAFGFLRAAHRAGTDPGSRGKGDRHQVLPQAVLDYDRQLAERHGSATT
jgi:hypothetical protein